MSAASEEMGRFVDVGGVATHYHDRGGGTPVLLVHGSGPGVSAWANWRTVLPPLSRHHRVLAPDVVGFGHTERPPGIAYGPEMWLRHLLEFLDVLDVPKVSVVGNSFGGALALRLAATAPERVDRLVLMGSAGVRFQLTPGLDAVWGFEPSLEAMRELLEVFTYDTSKIRDDLAGLRLEAATRAGVHEAYSAMFPAPRQNAVDELALPDKVIASVKHETLIFHGRDDRVIPLSASLWLNELLDNSQLHVFARCGHWVQIEQNVRFVAMLEDFLSPAAAELSPATG